MCSSVSYTLNRASYDLDPRWFKLQVLFKTLVRSDACWDILN